MSPSSLSAVYNEIQQNGSHASLKQQLDWLEQFAQILAAQGSHYNHHNAYHPDSINLLLAQYDRLHESQIASFLHDKLQRTLNVVVANAQVDYTEQTVISSSFVLSTLVDMLNNPEQPFEVAALMFESQTMFDEWYDQLLAMTGLEKRV